MLGSHRYKHVFWLRKLILKIGDIAPLSMTTESRKDLNKRFNEEKQKLCTCVIQFGTFLCHPLQNDDMK